MIYLTTFVEMDENKNIFDETSKNYPRKKKFNLFIFLRPRNQIEPQMYLKKYIMKVINYLCIKYTYFKDGFIVNSVI